MYCKTIRIKHLPRSLSSFTTSKLFSSNMSGIQTSSIHENESIILWVYLVSISDWSQSERYRWRRGCWNYYVRHLSISGKTNGVEQTPPWDGVDKKIPSMAITWTISSSKRLFLGVYRETQIGTEMLMLQQMHVSTLRGFFIEIQWGFYFRPKISMIRKVILSVWLAFMTAHSKTVFNKRDSLHATHSQLNIN